MSHAYSPHAIRFKLGCKPPQEACTPPRHNIELLARLHAICCCSRPPHATFRSCASRQSADEAAAGRQARAATLCRHTCRMLESDAVVSMGRLAEVSRCALPLRDGYQRSSYGAWRPGDGVRSTSHRPCRVAAKICADLLRALDGGTFSARALHALDVGSFGVDSAHATESTDLICVVMQWRRQPWRSHALGRLSAIARYEKKFP